MHHFINDWKHFSFNRLSWNTNWFHWCYQIIWISWKILQQYTLHLADSNSRRTIHWGYIYHLWIGGWCYLWVRLHLIIFDILSKLYWKRKILISGKITCQSMMVTQMVLQSLANIVEILFQLVISLLAMSFLFCLKQTMI